MLNVLSGLKFRVLVCCQPPHKVEPWSLRLIHKQQLRTTAQSFMCYMYTLMDVL
jgi:hypothetical protein